MIEVRLPQVVGDAPHFCKKTFSSRAESHTLQDSRWLVHRRLFGQIPKWPTGEDCKSSGFAFTGSNPVLPTPPHSACAKSGNPSLTAWFRTSAGQRLINEVKLARSPLNSARVA